MRIADKLIRNIREAQTEGADREQMFIRLTGAEYAQLKAETTPECPWWQELVRSKTFFGIPVTLLH